MTKYEEKVQIEFQVDETKYDESNQLVISNVQTVSENNNNNNNNDNKKKKKHEKKIKIRLSNKSKKKLEKILERKKRKLNRSKLINDLEQYKATSKEYNLMPSTSVVQTTGKRKMNDLLKLYNSIKNNGTTDTPDNNQSFSQCKKFKIIKLKKIKKNVNRTDVSSNHNVVGLDNGVENSDNEDHNDQYNKEEKEKPNDSSDLKVISQNDSNSTQNKSTKSNDQIKTKKSINSDKQKHIKNKQKNEETKSTKSIYVVVDRPEEIQKDRLKLPILAEEHNIMDAIRRNLVVIICAETGAGKTTQIPQFLYEAGFTLNGKIIGITEPRRVAAISISKRVAYELNLSEDEVSYQIRFENNVTDRTKIKFMTDGILMKEIERNFLLEKYSAIVIDEAHERSLYSDVLIGFLSRIIHLRFKKGNPLRLIIMSATLQVEIFTQNPRLFPNPPPVIKIESRQYPVSIHFSKCTNPNYLQEAYKKVCKIHALSPPGGILVFVTGRREVLSLCQMLKNKFPFNDHCTKTSVKAIVKEEDIIESNIEEQIEEMPKTKVNLDLYSIVPVENERVDDDFDYYNSENEGDDSDLEDEKLSDFFSFVTTNEPLYCLPLYSMMPTEKQSLVFEKPPPGCRLCVVATNVAETSLTIPNIKYVIDTGKVKNKVYDNITSISTFIVEWTSKARADQRAGRAGRTSAGYCYRLYSSAVFNDKFSEHAVPEILRKPVDDLLLQMKFMGVDNVFGFPFPSQPNIQALISAEKRLMFLEAIETKTFVGKKNKEVNVVRITHIGKLMAYFPVNPRYSKMICLGKQCKLMPITLAIIAILSVQELFLPDVKESTMNRRKNFFFTSPYCQVLGDLMVFLSAFGAVYHEELSSKFCERFGIRYKAIVQINKLRLQLLSQVKQITKDVTISPELPVPSENQVRMLSQLFLSAFGDHIAKRIPFIFVNKDENGTLTNIRKNVRNCYQSTEVDEYVFISPHSVLYNETHEYVVYHEIYQESSKLYMRHVVPIQVEWIPLYASKLCTFSKPLHEPPPRYDPKDDKIKCYRKATFSRYHWEMPTLEVDYPDITEKYAYFAYFLFSGCVLKSFVPDSKFLSGPPIMFIKPWGILQTKVENIIKCLAINDICTKRSIIEKWKIDKNFLLKEYLHFIHESQHENIRKNWPPLN